MIKNLQFPGYFGLKIITFEFIDVTLP